VTSSADAGCKSLISVCFSKIAGAPIGLLKFLGGKEESMACALRRYEVMDSGFRQSLNQEKAVHEGERLFLIRVLKSAKIIVGRHQSIV
jgi:hypothetical protein